MCSYVRTDAATSRSLVELIIVSQHTGNTDLIMVA
jgi:hypothetical protein